MECTSQRTGAEFITFCMKLTSAAYIAVKITHSTRLSMIPMALRFLMYQCFMSADTVKEVPFNVVCINMTDWEIQIFISDLKKIVQFGSVVFDVI
jgi:hypothetical protein